MKKKPPSVVRSYAPDREAQTTAVKLLIERTPAKPGTTPTDERHGNIR